MRLPIAAMLGVTLIALPQLASAQSLTLSSKDSDKPITVTYEKELQWVRPDKLFVARGNAKAVQEDTEVTADELIAHYRSKPATGQAAKAAATDDSDGDVYRVDAVGHVVVRSKDETATGAAAVYDFDRKVLVLEGDLVTLTSTDGTVTAHRTLQYWSGENVAVAEGNAVAIDNTAAGAGRRIRGDKLTAYFRDAPEKSKSPSAKGRDLIYLQGAGNVVLTTQTQTVSGDRGNYNLETGAVSVEGNVKMGQGKNLITGGYASGNVKGTITVLPGNKGPGAGPPPRVRALLVPNSATDDPPKPAGKAP